MEQSISSQEVISLFKKNRIVILPVAILLVAAVLTWLFLIPNIQKTQEAIATQREEQQKLQTLRNKVTILTSVNKTEELNLLKKIVAVLPEEKDVFTIFTGIDSLEKDSGVVVTQSDFRIGVVSTESAKRGVAASVKDKLSIDIQFEAVGSPDAIKKLFDILGTVKTRLFTAQKVNIEYATPTQMTVSFVLTAYFLPFAAQLGSVDSPLPVLSANLETLRELISRESLPVTEEVPDVPRGKTNLFSQ